MSRKKRAGSALQYFRQTIANLQELSVTSGVAHAVKLIADLRKAQLDAYIAAGFDRQEAMAMIVASIAAPLEPARNEGAKS